MILMFLKYQLAGIWPLLTYFGVGGGVVLACIVIFMFTPAVLLKVFPNIKKVLLWIATIAVAAMTFTAIGVTIGERRIQAQWDQAGANALATVKKAHAGAIRDVTRKPSHGLRNGRRKDPDQRD